jgi:signal transduction histidine kinase
MSSESPSRLSDRRTQGLGVDQLKIRGSFWPQSLFGRLIAASIVALLLAQLVSLVLIARERERFILQGSVREWSRRIAEVTALLEGMDDTERATMVARLSERPWRYGRRPPDAIMFRDGLVAGPEADPAFFPGPRGRGGPGGLGIPGLPGAGRSEGAWHDAARPGADRSEGGRPDAAQPGVGRSGAARSDAAQAEAARPDVGHPGAGRHGDGPPEAREHLDRHLSRMADSGLPQGTSQSPPASAHQGSARQGHLEPPGAGQLGPPGTAQPGPRLPGSQQPGPAGPSGQLGPPPEDSRSLILRATTYQTVVPFTKAGDFEGAFEQQLRTALGSGFEVDVTQTADPTKRAISIGGPLFSEVRDSSAEFYDAKVKFPDGYTAVFRVTRFARGAPLPRGLFMNLALLVIVMSIALFVVARSITRPLSDLARAADSVGRDLRQPKIAERGAREIRNAARAFNTMQDRMQRYLDSRSRVLAAMSHDLKTPLTRLRLQVEMLDDSAAQLRLGKQLDEMESMVHGALALFRGLDDNEAFTPLDINDLLATLQSEFAEMSAQVPIEGHAARSILGKPQALRRCLTNLIANAVKFGSQAAVVVEDGSSLVIRVRDDGPGIPEDQLERVFEPFYRLESSRNRDTGGSGLGLSIARDVIQAHGGSLVLRNLPARGLEAVVTLPRA